MTGIMMVIHENPLDFWMTFGCVGLWISRPSDGVKGALDSFGVSEHEPWNAFWLEWIDDIELIRIEGTILT